MRRIVQVGVLLLVSGLALGHQYFGVEKVAPIDAYCPFGAVEGMLTLIFTGEFVKRIFTSSFILLAIFLVSTLILGRVFCGYFCPLGTIQEGIRAIGRKLGLKKDLELPSFLDKYLRYVKYLILAVIVYYSFSITDLGFRAYDPYNALMHFGEEFDEKVFAYAILGLLLVLSIFSKNWWCRYFCPLGAFLSIFKKIGLIKIERNQKTCISCGACDQVCPAGLEIKEADEVRSADCVSCGKCIGHCPKSSLQYKIWGTAITLTQFNRIALLLIVIPLIVLPFTPLWKTKPESNLINTQGQLDTSNIRGSNTLQYVIDTTGVPFEVFQEKMGLPSDADKKLKLKEIGTKYDLKNAEGNYLEAEEFRAVIDEYLLERSSQKKEETPVSYYEAQEKESALSCPFNETNCEFPGECASYVDANQNKICDRSE